MASEYDTEQRQWAEADRAASGAESGRLLRYRRALAAIGGSRDAQRLLARLSYLKVVDGGGKTDRDKD